VQYNYANIFGPRDFSDPSIIGLVGFDVLTAMVNEYFSL
jgi:hypothetical protein